jgi:hypothetical protein
MFEFLPKLALPEAIGVVAAIVMAIAGFIAQRALLRNLYVADWWARNVKLRGWKRKTAGIDNRASWEATGMPAAEKECCDYYLNYARATDRRTFTNAVEWLKLTGQGETRHMPAGKLTILFILTMGEALGTGVLLASAISDGVTQSELAPYGFIIAVIMAFGLLGLTHIAGRQQAFANAIQQYLSNSIRTERQINQKLSPADDYRIDDEVDGSVRFANRALNGPYHRAGMTLRILALLFLTALVVGIFAVRVVDNHNDYIKAVQELGPAAGCGGAGAGSPSDPFSGSSIPGFSAGTNAPPSVTCNATSADNGVDKQGFHGQELSKDISAAILALAYVFVQFLGFRWAVQHSFFDEGEKAFAITRGYPTYDELYRDKLEPVYKLGNSCLSQLRNYFMARINAYRDDPSHLGIQDFAVRKQYKDDSHLSEEERDNKIGMDAYQKAVAFRKKLTPKAPESELYPSSLARYRHLVELQEYRDRLGKEAKMRRAETEFSAIAMPSPAAANPPKSAAPMAALREQLAAQTIVNVAAAQKPLAAPDLAGYDELDIEAAEEMLQAVSVLERKQILDALAGGNAAKQAVIQEIYRKLKDA